MIKLYFYILFFISLSSCSLTKLEEQLPKELLTKDQVGAARMPDTMVVVKTPFSTDSKISIPFFPENQVIVTPGSLIIQHAIDSLASKGGGKVILTSGTYYTGRITLKSNINLHLEDGVELVFKADIEDFLPVVFTRNEGVELYSLGACIYANGAENIAITGKGKIIGPGEGTVRSRTMTHDVIENIVDYRTPVAERIYDGKTASYIFPPALIAPIHCKNIFIEGVQIERSAFWNIVPTYCENVIIRGVTIRSVGIQRGDGIDIESSKNVLIEYCTFHTGDDCIALKAGRGYDGLRVNRPSENIVVRYCLAAAGHGGLTIGSETAGLIKKVYVHDCVFDGADVGIRFKTRRPRGGGGEDFSFENIRMRVVHSALRWDMLGQALHVGKQADRDYAVEVNDLTPRFSNITMNNILIEDAADCIKIEGIPESPLSDVRLTNIVGKGQRYLVARDVRNISVQNAIFSVSDRQVDTINVEGLAQKNVQFSKLCRHIDEE